MEFAAIVGILLATVAVSLVWLRLVPIFESPDEPQHFDYVYSLVRAGHLLKASDGPGALSPTTVSLMGQVGMSRVPFHADQAVPAGYGRPEFMRQLSAATPQTPRSYFAGRRHPVPVLTGVYPFGSYALIALVVALFGGDPVRMLFVARAACLGFAIAGLLFGYLTLRELGVRVRLALPLLAVMGLFPLTSFVSSYVQPDNVSFALSSLTIYAAMRLRRRGPGWGAFATYACALTALCATKYQFGAVVGAVTLPYVMLRLVRTELRPAGRVGAVAALLLFPLAALLFTHAYSVGGVGYSSASLTRGAAGGGAALLPWIGRALTDYFSFGAAGLFTSASYWHDFGWVDYTVNPRPRALSVVLYAFIQYGTYAVGIAACVLTLQNARRIIFIGRTRGAAAGLRLAFGDPLVNAYLAFALFMIALYAFSQNAFGAQGRNWYPLLPGAFALTVVYAPKVLPRGMVRRAAGWLGLGFYVVWSAVVSYWAVVDVAARYYHPMPASPRFSLFTLAESAWTMSGSIDDARLERGGLFVRGWVADLPRRHPAAAVAVLVDNRFAGWARGGQPRGDVAQALRDDVYGAAGFEVTLPAPGRGTHRVRVAAVEANGVAYQIDPQERTVFKP